MSNHRISVDSTYDADMTLCEDFVRAHNNPNNVEAQTIVHRYYLNRLQSYWLRTKHYLNSDVAKIDFQNYRSSRPDFTLTTQFETLESKFNHYLEILNQNFDTSGKLDLRNIRELFFFISQLLSFRQPSIMFYSESDNDGKFPLPNDTGLFGLNSYLYCAFEGVFLIGYPITMQKYDGRMGPSFEFALHDLNHRNNIAINDDLSNYKCLYYYILNHESFTPLIRELFILNLWTVMHELYDPNTKIRYRNSSLEEFLNALIKVIPIVSEFNSEYCRLIDLINLTDVNLIKSQILEFKNKEAFIRNIKATYTFLGGIYNHITMDLLVERKVDDPILDMITICIIVQGMAWIWLQKIYHKII